MRRFLIIVIPIITLIIFVFIMLSGTILKKPFGKFDDVPGSIDDIIAAVNDEDWDDLANKLNGLEKAWDRSYSEYNLALRGMKSINCQHVLPD